jgi:hypothetical protein
VKLQNDDEGKLTAGEKEALKCFLLSTENGDASEDDEDLSFIDIIFRQADEQEAKKKKSTKYRSTLHVSPTSCICEQTNSQAKHIMRDTRKSMDPSSLESILVLKFNHDLWNIKTVNAIIKRMESSSSISAGGSGGGVSGLTIPMNPIHLTPSSTSVVSSLSASSL